MKDDNAPINVNPWRGGGGCKQRVGIWSKSKNFGQFPEGGEGYIRQFNVAKKSPPTVLLVTRLSLDPIDRSPFRHLMKFTQHSFPLY